MYPSKSLLFFLLGGTALAIPLTGGEQTGRALEKRVQGEGQGDGYAADVQTRKSWQAGENQSTQRDIRDAAGKNKSTEEEVSGRDEISRIARDKAGKSVNAANLAAQRGDMKETFETQDTAEHDKANAKAFRSSVSHQGYDV